MFFCLFMFNNKGMPNRVLVINLVRRSAKGKIKKRIQRTALKILKILGKNNVSAEIYLIDSQKMRFLNKKFRGKNKTTNILSFKEPRNFIFPPSTFRKIGEIYIKFPTTDYPINYLLIHGLLHLFGYTHYRKSDKIRMEKLENWIIRELENGK